MIPLHRRISETTFRLIELTQRHLRMSSVIFNIRFTGCQNSHNVVSGSISTGCLMACDDLVLQRYVADNRLTELLLMTHTLNPYRGY